ncbi:MAG: amylo-alpha-1,6-glucosidase, partial [Planctomycetota bacterium]
QISARPALLVAAEDNDGGPWSEQFNTGKADWKARREHGYKLLPTPRFFGTGDNVEYHKSWEVEAAMPAKTICAAQGAGSVRSARPPWLLVPARLPDQVAEPVTSMTVVHIDAGKESDPFEAEHHLPDEVGSWQTMLERSLPSSHAPSVVRVPSGKKRRVLVKLDNYVCAYTLARLRGRGMLKMRISESLYNEHPDQTEHKYWGRCEKGDRAAHLGKYFDGIGDNVKASSFTGSEVDFRSPWWNAGRWLLLLVESDQADVDVVKVGLQQTHYPHTFESTIDLGEDAQLVKQLEPLCIRTLEMCTHTTYMDCPTYEQLQYTGDTRLQVLLQLATTRDDRLPRQAILAYDHSRRNDGLAQSRYPIGKLHEQYIPGFALWWIAMVHDYAMWRDEPDFICGRLPGVRAVLDYFLGHVEDGLLRSTPGWNFIDWVPAWDGGIPPGGIDGFNVHLNFQLLDALQKAAALEREFGRATQGQMDADLAADLAATMNEKFWDASAGLYRETPDHTESWSDHAQVLAILTGTADAARSAALKDWLLGERDAHATTTYFRHYLFELAAHVGEPRLVLDQLGPWRVMLEQNSLTTWEAPPHTRSDCHAWSAHPLLHGYTTLLGIRPGSFGFKTVRVTPLVPGEAQMVHRSGTIAVNAKGDGDPVVTLPAGVERAEG